MRARRPRRAEGRRQGGGGTVNDAVLAVVSGMLRRYLDDGRGRRPGRPRPGRAGAGVRAREGETRAATTSPPCSSTCRCARPTRPPHAVDRRADAQAARVGRRARRRPAGRARRARSPPVVASMLVRAMGNVRAFNLVVSNVPGPQMPFYMNGAKLLEAYPAVPLNPGNQRLTVGILSYDGGVHFGLLADAKLDPPVEVAADALVRGARRGHGLRISKLPVADAVRRRRGRARAAISPSRTSHAAVLVDRQHLEAEAVGGVQRAAHRSPLRRVHVDGEPTRPRPGSGSTCSTSSEKSSSQTWRSPILQPPTRAVFAAIAAPALKPQYGISTESPSSAVRGRRASARPRRTARPRRRGRPVRRA